MDIKDITQLIKEYNEYDVEDTYNSIKELIEEIENNTDNVIKQLQEELDKFCDEKDLCKCCGSRLNYYNYQEMQGEYMGSPAYEDTSEPFCPNGCIQD